MLWLPFFFGNTDVVGLKLYTHFAGLIRTICWCSSRCYMCYKNFITANAGEHRASLSHSLKWRRIIYTQINIHHTRVLIKAVRVYQALHVFSIYIIYQHPITQLVPPMFQLNYPSSNYIKQFHARTRARVKASSWTNCIVIPIYIQLKCVDESCSSSSFSQS